MTSRRLNEDFMSTLSSGIRSLLDIPIVKSIVSTLSGGGASDDESSPDPDKLQFGEMLRDLMQEKIPLRVVLEADTDKRGLIVGSSQSGIIGPYVMQGMESRGFKSFNFGSSALRTPRTMRLVFASIASGLKDKDEYDVIVIFAGYRSGETTSDIIDIVNLFTPGRCFVVIPPPVTTIDNTLEASRIGINKGRPLSEDFWFLLRGGKYARDREQYCNDLTSAVRSAGATSIDPRNIVAGGTMQPSGVAFPNSPDGIHASQDVNMKIASAIVEKVFSCEIPVPASQVAKKIKPGDLERNPALADHFSSFPATAAILGIAAVGGKQKRTKTNSNSAEKSYADSDLVKEQGTAEDVIKYFMDNGWTFAQACGFAANINQESGFKTYLWGDGGKAYGLVQWHPPRRKIFKDNFGKDIQQASFREQLNFVLFELANDYKRAANVIAAQTTAAGAAAEIDKSYEQSAGTERASRQRMAEKYYNMYSAKYGA